MSTTTKRRWFPIEPPNGKRGSVRMAAYHFVDNSPGISSAALVELWSFPTPVDRVLRELEHSKHIRSELE